MSEKIVCQICQREFESNKSLKSLSQHIVTSHNISKKDYYDKYMKKECEGICPECGKETNFLKLRLNNAYRKYCSCSCAANSKEKQNKMKQTCLERYNVEYSGQSQIKKDKCKITYLKHYGVEHALQSKELKDKMKQTCLERYGVNSPFKCRDILNKRIQARIINYYNNTILNLKEVKPLFSLEDYIGVRVNNKDIKYKWQCNTCGHIFEDHIHGKLPRCLICHPIDSGFSLQEKEVVAYIKSIYAGPIIENTKQIIAPLELDIYLPELKLAVEYNGDYWHSLLPKNYHTNKTKYCKSKGIKLIHISESEWLNNQINIKENINNNILNKGYNYYD